MRHRVILSKKKYAICFFEPQHFCLHECFTKWYNFSVEHFINEILKELYEKTKTTHNNSCHNVCLHFDNVRPHTSRKVTKFEIRYHVKKISWLNNSYDITSIDFSLFFYIKHKLQNEYFDSVYSFYEKVIEILNENLMATLQTTFQEQERRLDKTINNEGVYIE